MEIDTHTTYDSRLTELLATIHHPEASTEARPTRTTRSCLTSTLGPIQCVTGRRRQCTLDGVHGSCQDLLHGGPGTVPHTQTLRTRHRFSMTRLSLQAIRDLPHPARHRQALLCYPITDIIQIGIQMQGLRG
jgi:hypothetical protein